MQFVDIVNERMSNFSYHERMVHRQNVYIYCEFVNNDHDVVKLV